MIPGSQVTISTERDIAGNTELPVDRFYRSSVLFGPQISLGQWIFGWQRELDVGASTSRGRISALRDDGTVFVFQLNGRAWAAIGTQDTLQPVSDAAGNVTGWQYTVIDTGAVENYAADGKLQSVRERNGRTTTLAYNAARQLTSVTAPSGRSLIFVYDNQSRVASVTIADGATTQYAYNAAGMLSTVTYPDSTTRQYVYEDSRLPTALTGVIDENGGRYVTYAYDASGHAVSSSLANGVNHYQFQYGNGNYTNVTDPTSKISAYSFLRQNGELLLTSVNAPCAACGSTRKSSSYDTDNNLIREVDYNGAVITHSYDAQHREIQRVEGAGTAAARTITTAWHPQFWNLRTQVASPTKLEVYSYDANGNLISYSETPTADMNGSQGFSATAAGPTRTTTWTYTSDGQVASSSGPRTDVATGTTYVYRPADDTNAPPQYRKGDLYQIVDPLGHTSTINRYDSNGRPLQMADANGAVTTFTYSNRGWLTSQVVTPISGAAQTTNYSYDAVGQLTKVTLPDGSSVSFTYDGAHRMTGAADSLGNSVSYTLDAMGNRTQEQSKDPSGNLARQITRVFDSMNRPLKITVGATQ
ncbi:RHS repeat domain-containing protein [Ralstonia sp. SM1864_UCD524_TZ4]|nr:RHS repeat domain-containing protein [Ralstonia pseudosolanacearum]